MLLLDTLPLVDFFKADLDYIRNLLLDSEGGKVELGISVVTISELFYILAGFKNEDFARACIDNIKTQLKLVHLNVEIAEKAGELKFHYAGKGKKGLPMADAIIAATAWFHGAELVTSDDHFDKIKEIKLRKL